MRNEDVRSKKIAFISSCIMNSNNKVRELARYSDCCHPIMDLLRKYQIGIQQMDCPETLYLGIDRWSATKNLYDTPGYRRHCKELAHKQVDYVKIYYDAGYDVVALLWINGSPSCGWDITCYGKEWGGTPVTMGEKSTFVKGKGVFVEEMQKEFRRRNIKMPMFFGINLEDMSIPVEQSYKTFKSYLEENMFSCEEV